MQNMQKKICKICQVNKHLKYVPRYAKYVSRNRICRICTPDFASADGQYVTAVPVRTVSSRYKCRILVLSSCTDMYQYVPGCTNLPDPVQVYRIPDTRFHWQMPGWAAVRVRRPSAQRRIGPAASGKVAGKPACESLAPWLNLLGPGLGPWPSRSDTVTVWGFRVTGNLKPGLPGPVSLSFKFESAAAAVRSGIPGGGQPGRLSGWTARFRRLGHQWPPSHSGSESPSGSGRRARSGGAGHARSTESRPRPPRDRVVIGTVPQLWENSSWSAEPSVITTVRVTSRSESRLHSEFFQNFLGSLSMCFIFSLPTPKQLRKQRRTASS